MANEDTTFEALNAIADKIQPFEAAWFAAWDAIGRTSKTGAEEIADLNAAAKILDVEIRKHLRTIADITNNSLSNIEMMARVHPDDVDFHVAFSGAASPSQYLRAVAKYRSFNQNYWTSQGWTGFTK